MTLEDQPAFAHELPPDPVDVSADPALPEKIRRLGNEQPFGVLCTQGGGESYGSLVAFAFSADLRSVVFATSVATRKYRLLTECDHVALVIDNRPQHPEDLMEIEVLTVTGRAREIERGEARSRYAERLVSRHPYLRSFVESASCALFLVDVVRCVHVARFQEVGQWVPPTPSVIRLTEADALEGARVGGTGTTCLEGMLR